MKNCLNRPPPQLKKTELLMGNIVYRHSGGEFVCDSCSRLKSAADKNSIDFRALAHPPYPGVRLPENELRGLSSTGFWDARKNQTWGLGRHRNEGLEISWLENGKLDFAYKSVKRFRVRLNANSLTITRPWQEHSLGGPNISRSRLYWIILDFNVRAPNENWVKPDWIILSKQDFAELSKRVKESDQCAFAADKSIASSFKALAGEIMSGEGASVSQIAILANQILLSALNILKSQSKNSDEYFSSNEYCVRLFLEQIKEISNASWTLPEMAEHCGLKETRFAYYCKKITNMTPLEYLSEIRLQKAAELLRSNPGMKVTDVAFQSGFSSSQYFATAFKKKFGTPPSRLR